MFDYLNISLIQSQFRRQEAENLITNVILPVTYTIYQLPDVVHYFEDEVSLKNHRLLVSRFALTIYFFPEEAENVFYRMQEKHRQVAVPKSLLLPLLVQFFQCFSKWLEETVSVGEEHKCKVKSVLKKMVSHLEASYPDEVENHSVKYEGVSAKDEGDFLFTENAPVDEAINQMHNITHQQEVMSAQTYMQSHPMDDHLIAELKEELKELADLFFEHTHFDVVFAKIFAQKLQYLANLLYDSMEFENIGASLIKLNDMLTTAEESNELSPETLQMVHDLLEQLIKDLTAWVYHIFIDEDAVDIHYLDAALFASIAQIEMMLQAETSDDNEEAEDDFMF